MGQRRTRLDVELVRRGLAKSRERAQQLILAGRVRVNSRPATKADMNVDSSVPIDVLPWEKEYASRGAYKLLAALDYFRLHLEGRRALDVGASSGGFTDVLLRRGVSSVIALDVGYGQLALRLRQDPRVIVKERTNIRYVTQDDIPYAPDLVTIDVSFISLRLVLPPVLKLMSRPGDVIALIKPQFEVGKGNVGKGGVVRDPSLQLAARDEILNFARSIGLEVIGSLESPILGDKGNKEFLTLLHLEQ